MADMRQLMKQNMLYFPLSQKFQTESRNNHILLLNTEAAWNAQKIRLQKNDIFPFLFPDPYSETASLKEFFLVPRRKYTLSVNCPQPDETVQINTCGDQSSGQPHCEQKSTKRRTIRIGKSVRDIFRSYTR